MIAHPIREIPAGDHRLAKTGLLGLLLALAGACGGTPDADGGAEAGGDPGSDAATPAAAESAPTSGGQATDGTPGGGEHAHGPETHTHEAGTHTHPSADTIASGVALESTGGAGTVGTASVLAVGDSLRIRLEVREAEPGARYTAELVAGSCSDPGELLASLTPVMAGSSGEGTSQTTLEPGGAAGHAHGAIRLAEGAGSACGPVHLSDSHEHPDG